jgi:glutamate N-acetyltransferase/amino-acid N-acetyltransferase
VIRPLPPPRGLSIIRGGGVTSPKGFVAGGVAAGIKTARGALDVGLLASERPCASAAMFTRSRVLSNAVRVSAMHARGQACRAVVVNSGCSNVATGDRGLRDAQEMAELAAERAGVAPGAVIVGSTGVIGRMLPMPKIRAGLRRVSLAREGGHDFARANMTTDTFTKEVAVRVSAGGQDYVIGGCAKGSGMIHPDMATMFCWLTTDAAVERRFLAYALHAAVGDSLNMISVDGDTSTSDTTAVLANGAAGGPPIEQSTPRGTAFARALRYVCVSLARMLARDGEGADKLIEVRIEGAANEREARAAARTVTASPLVKSAVHGNDPNWGRVLMAIGRSGAGIDLDRARVWLGPIPVYRGAPVKYDERAASRYLRGEEVLLRADLGTGAAKAAAWGCDLTPEYVRINSDYTT